MSSNENWSWNVATKCLKCFLICRHASGRIFRLNTALHLKTTCLVMTHELGVGWKTFLSISHLPKAVFYIHHYFYYNSTSSIWFNVWFTFGFRNKVLFILAATLVENCLYYRLIGGKAAFNNSSTLKLWGVLMQIISDPVIIILINRYIQTCNTDFYKKYQKMQNDVFLFMKSHSFLAFCLLFHCLYFRRN